MKPTKQTIDTNIKINAPIHSIWTALTDLEGYATWNPYLFQVTGNAVAGQTISVHSRPIVEADPLVQDVTVLSAAPYAMCWEGGMLDKSLFRGEHWFDFQKPVPTKPIFVTMRSSPGQ